jgi:hypothetical protein
LVLAMRSNACCCSLLSFSAVKSVCAIATIFLWFVCKGTGLMCSETSQDKDKWKWVVKTPLTTHHSVLFDGVFV